MSLYLGENLISGLATPIEPTRNIGQIIQSTIPLTDAGLHLLDGALISGSGSYADFVDYIAELYANSPKKSNVTKVGSLTDNDGVLSGFSDSNYAIIPSVFAPNSSTWEMVFKYTTSSNVTTAQSIKGAATGTSNVLIRVSANSKFQIYLSSGTSSWDITNNGSIQGTYTVLANTSYWVKLVFDGSKYVLSYSLDGINYINDITVNNSTPVSSGIQWIGRAAVTNQYAFGSIDLKESYININGQRWWTGANPSWATDETTWQNSVTTYGVCGKFVYNSSANTVRLPKITGFIEGTTDVTTLGDLIEAGLPNITGRIGVVSTATGLWKANMQSSGAFYPVTVLSGTQWYAEAVSNTNTDTNDAGFDASRSSSIYGNSSTVQPQSVKVLYYIVIATTTKTDIEVDIDEIATDLNGKADVDLSNINTAGKSFASGLAMPSSSYIDLTLGASGSAYTAPANGYFCFNGKDSGNTGTAGVVLRNQTRYFGVAGTNTDSAKTPAWTGYILPAKKGDTIYLYYIGTLASNNTNWAWRFYYAEGEA